MTYVNSSKVTKGQWREKNILDLNDKSSSRGCWRSVKEYNILDVIKILEGAEGKWRKREYSRYTLSFRKCWKNIPDLEVLKVSEGMRIFGSKWHI